VARLSLVSDFHVQSLVFKRVFKNRKSKNQRLSWGPKHMHILAKYGPPAAHLTLGDNNECSEFCSGCHNIPRRWYHPLLLLQVRKVKHRELSHVPWVSQLISEVRIQTQCIWLQHSHSLHAAHVTVAVVWWSEQGWVVSLGSDWALPFIPAFSGQKVRRVGG
jgi:hypothetical protein